MEKDYRIGSFDSNPEGRIIGINWEEERWDEEFFIFLPYSDLRTWIYTEDFLYKASQAFPTSRLAGIKQLSLLSWTGPDPEKVIFTDFNHTRFEHTLVVAKLTEEILKQNGTANEDKEKAVVASILHDIATPAGGDPVKSVDPENLDEEEYWFDVLSDKGWKFLEERRIGRGEIHQIIKNKGYLGEVLDIADRIQYVFKDLSQVIGDPSGRLDGGFWGVSTYEAEDSIYRELSEIIRRNPKLGDIYKNVKISTNKELYFEDSEKLGEFLKIRALLHKYLYSNPVCQEKDIRLANFVSQFYSSSEENEAKLTPSKLRRMSDGELFDWIAKASKTEGIDSSFIFRLFFGARADSRYEKFESLEDAKLRAKEIKDNPDLQFLGLRYWKGFNPGTDYKVLNEKGEIVQFKDVCPQTAAGIQEAANSTKGAYLFYNTTTISDFDYPELSHITFHGLPTSQL